MRRTVTSTIAILLLMFSLGGLPAFADEQNSALNKSRITSSFDSGWRFFQGDAPGAERSAFNDKRWQSVDVPHDWSIAGPFDQSNPTAAAGAFLPAGIGWYRKHFRVPAKYAHRRVYIDFDGVMANSDLWINGFHLGKRPYGYVSFRYELTGHLNFGATSNIIAVRADNSSQPASRWYTGAGIYRHVRLVIANPVHLEHWGTFITTPEITHHAATVRLQTTVMNQSAVKRNVALHITLISPTGKTVQSLLTKGQTIAVSKSADFQQDIVIDNPELWDLDEPHLYHAVIQVRSGNAVLDDESVALGIREFHFDAATGFWLNGRNLKIKGVCLHHDGGALGAAVPLGVWQRRLHRLRALGVNAIRTAHNPPAPEFLDLCDRMGFLVLDELFDCWTIAKNPYDYHLYFEEWSQIDARDTILRDRNHPSIFAYSVGNEIHDTPRAELAKRILASLVTTLHRADPTRPVTQALFRPNVSHDYDDGLADLLDVVGQNYRENEILAAHEQKPERKILGTENGHDLKVWLALRDNPAYSGQFLWSGIDYLGEAHQWPTIANGSGLLDRTGTPRPLAFQRQSWWSEKPMVYITRRVAVTAATPTDPGYEAVPQRYRQVLFSDWTPRDTAPHIENIEVYSNCKDVELFLNDKSLGSKPRPPDDAPRTWTVQFEPGTLKALGRNDGKIVATYELRTAGKPARIELTADRGTFAPLWDDVLYINTTVVDENGVIVPDASNLITFDISGPGTIAAVDNGDNASHEPFHANQRSAFHGSCIAVLRATSSTGQIVVNASALGLKSGTVAVTTTRPIPAAP